MDKYRVTGYEFNSDGDFAIINDDESFKISMDDIAAKIIEEYHIEKYINPSVINRISNKIHREIKNTGISPDTVLLSEEYYGALKYESMISNPYFKNEIYNDVETVFGLKIRRCEGYNVMVVYKDITKRR